MSIRPVTGKCEVLRSAALGWYVEHPKSNAILAYADTRDEAVAFASAYDRLMSHFDSPSMYTGGGDTPIDDHADPPRGPYLSWVVRIEVAPLWVAEGFNLGNDDDATERLVSGLLPYANGYEFAAQVLARPDAQRIKRLTGETK